MNFNINEYIDEKIYSSLRTFLNKDDRVLEIGSGYGEYSFEIAKNVKNIVALDMDKNKLSEMQNIVKKRNIKNISIVNTRIEDYIPQNKFDKIIIIQSLGYINSQNFIKILNNNLKDNGNLFILDLTKNLIFTTRRKIKYLLNSNIPKANNYSKNDLKLITNHFKNCNFSYFGIFIFFLPLIFFISKIIRLRIYNKIDKIIFLKHLSFKYLVVCKEFSKKRLS